MHLRESTHRNQSALASYCRTGVLESIDGINKKRIPHYRRLVLNVITDTLESAYPIARDLLTSDEWENLIDLFLSFRKCTSHQLWKMPFEFYDYVKSINYLNGKYPHLNDLLWFEWLEIDIYMMPDVPVSYKQGTFEMNKLVLNPEYQLQQFSYPIHLKKATEIDGSGKGNYYVVMHRHPESGKVYFTSVSAGLAAIIYILDSHPVALKELVYQACELLGTEYSEEINVIIKEFLQNAIESRLIIGFI